MTKLHLSMQIHIFMNRLRKYLDRDLFHSLNINTDIYFTPNKYSCIFTYLYLDIWSYKIKIKTTIETNILKTH